MIRLSLAALAAAILISGPPAASAPSAPAHLPARFESYLTNVVRPAARDRQALLRGEPITKLLEVDPSKEAAIFGAVWIQAPMQRYVAAVQDIETLERGSGFPITKRISSPPRLEDFAALHLPESDVTDLRRCRVGDCKLKLSERTIEKMRKEIDWSSPHAGASADALMRRIALDYVTGYLEGGNDRLAVYRDDPEPTFVAKEFRAMIDRMPELSSYMPEMRRYLLEYPKHTLANVSSFLYWQETKFGLKPTIRLSHLSIREGPEETVVASKMLYATHYFWTGLELRVLLPDPSRGQGFWFITVNRSRADGLSGFKGSLLRRVVRGEVQEGAIALLTSTKRRLEQR